MKHFRTLGLCLMAALSLMAFVGATQASALWLESGAVIAANLEGNIKIVGLEPEKEGGTPGPVHGVVTIPAKELEFLCGKAKAKDELFLAGTVLIKKTAELSECTTFQKKVESKGCKPNEPIVVKALSRLISGSEISIEPEEGSTKFGSVDFNEETCALPDTDVTGSLKAECLGEKYELSSQTKLEYCSLELVNHLFTESSSGLKYGANQMFLKGVLSLALNTGNKWSGHP